MKAHLLVFDGGQADRTLVRDLLDRMPSVENWTSFFGNAMCLASQDDARVLARRIREVLPNVRFLVTTIDPVQKGGWLPQDLWHFMNDPVPVTHNSDA